MTPHPAATAPPTTGLLGDLRSCVADPVQVHDGELDRHALASDASHFLLLPTAVVSPGSADEVSRLLRAGARQGVPLTFRSGGTSLSGQGVTDGVLVDVRRHFKHVEVLDDGARVRVQPGVTVRQLNTRLAPYQRKFGPDPASEAACTVGGVVANNSSGMACGTVENSYRTLESVVAVLPSGTVLDTGARDADEQLRVAEPELYAGLLALRDRVRGNPASVATIERQFAMKNTMGYGVNAFLDHDTASDILTHLIVGSEGTLAFVAEATFRTVPLRSETSSALLVFDDLYAANRALPELVATGAATLELMDAASLRVGQAFSDCPAAIAALDVDQHAALLLEYQATGAAELHELTSTAWPTLRGLRTTTPAQLTDDAAVRYALWKLRKGLYTSVAGARPPGTTALLEDIVVPVAALADTCVELNTLFDTYHYGADSVIFGHAKDGNIHFMITDRFAGPKSLRRYSDFTEDMVDLVLGHGGSLKAEHGTGRVMAPYVRRQYGDELYAVMTELKRLCDPGNVLNPGVLLSDDPEAHLKHIKLTPAVEEEVDRCVECGYCEPVCPSRDLTMTPRQRIVARRAIRSAELAGDSALAGRLAEQYEYPGVQTCAVDGMCQTACPVLINTGDLVKRLRRQDSGRLQSVAWQQAARHWAAASRSGAVALSTADRLPTALAPAVRAVNRAARAVLGTEQVPLWSPELPRGGSPRRRSQPTAGAGASRADAVYLPACVSSMFGPAAGGAGVQVAFEELCERVGMVLRVPEEIESLCCGTPWSSKGLPDGYRAMAERVLPVVLAATDGGQLPLVTDASSCTEGLVKLLATSPETAGVQVVDAMTFAVEHVLPRLGEHRRLSSVTVHPTCSSTQLGLNDALTTLAGEVAEDVHIPVDWGCCAFAGDRGMLHPELTASATSAQAAEVAAFGSEAHVSCNRTCELGMTRATGQDYRHVLELLAEVTRPQPSPADRPSRASG